MPLALGGGQKEGPQEESSARPSFGSLEKSLLLPGWGQMAEKRYVEAAVFLGSEIFCLAKVFSHNHKGNRYYSLYKEADNEADAIKYRGLTEKFDTKRNQYLLAALGVWAVNLIDIYVIVKGKQSKQKSMRFRLEGGEKPKALFVISYSY
jgi:hypothetical protein